MPVSPNIDAESRSRAGDQPVVAAKTEKRIDLQSGDVVSNFESRDHAKSLGRPAHAVFYDLKSKKKTNLYKRCVFGNQVIIFVVNIDLFFQLVVHDWLLSVM